MLAIMVTVATQVILIVTASLISSLLIAVFRRDGEAHTLVVVAAGRMWCKISM
jgi:hypothetical protein